MNDLYTAEKIKFFLIELHKKIKNNYTIKQPNFKAHRNDKKNV